MRGEQRWVGSLGIPSSIRRGTWEPEMGRLKQRGCGAWMGDHICGRTPTTHVVGGTPLLFATYVAATEPGGLTHAFLCAVHHPGEGAVNGRLIADMRQDILRDQRVELRRFWRRTGEGRPYPLPNVLEPETEEANR